MFTEAAYKRVDALGEQRVAEQSEMNTRMNQAWKRARFPDDLIPSENIFRLSSALDGYKGKIARNTSELRNVPRPLVLRHVASHTFPRSGLKDRGI